MEHTAVLVDSQTRTRLLGADSVDWLLASAEPGARWPTLTGVLADKGAAG